MSELSENSNQPFSMPTAFDPHPVEARWYAFWQEHNYFAPDESNAANGRYCITIPPPNVTGVLHLGHALQHSIHDCFDSLSSHERRGDFVRAGHRSRRHRHANQSRGNYCAKPKANRATILGREEFLRRVLGLERQIRRTIIEQMKALGCSYDWSRERFTMDEGYSAPS